jgi:hypothetical protein
MKLEFAVKRGFCVLKVAERVTGRDVDVLRAGLAKIGREHGKKGAIILDLTVALIEIPVKPRLKELLLLAFNQGFDLLIVSEDQQLGQFKRLQEATQLLISGSSLTGTREAILAGILKDLVRRRDELTKASDSLRDKHVVQGNLPDEIRHLNELLATMEKRAWRLIDELGDRRPEPRNPGIASAERELLSFIVKERMSVAEALK